MRLSRRKLVVILALVGGIGVTSVSVVLLNAGLASDATAWLVGALVTGVAATFIIALLTMGVVRDLIGTLHQVHDRSDSLGDRVAQLQRHVGGGNVTDEPLDRQLAELSGVVNKLQHRQEATVNLEAEFRKEVVDQLQKASDQFQKASDQFQKAVSASRDLEAESRKEVVDQLQKASDQIQKVALASREAFRDEISLTYRRLEGLVSIYQSLRPDLPLPAFGGWAISPDLGAHLVRLVHESKPALVVEAGSGLSSAILAFAMRRVGEGRLVCLEHDQSYAEATRKLFEVHALETVAEVVYAPLVSVDIGDESWLWYDFPVSKFHDGEIDLLFVDGPPGPTGPLARYPALPVLWSYLASDAAIVLDDADRRDERELVSRWEAEFPGLSIHRYGFDKGVVEIRR